MSGHTLEVLNRGLKSVFYFPDNFQFLNCVCTYMHFSKSEDLIKNIIQVD